MNIPKQVNTKLAVGLVLISVILASGLMYVFAATPTTVFWVSPGMYPGAPNFTVWRESTNYFAKDANGELQYSGTNASQVINDAIGDLTSGRTWIETVRLDGTLTLANPIELPSYTRLDIQGQLIISATMTAYLHFITNADRVNGNTNIEICNGIINGTLNADHATPATLPTDGLRAIRLYGCYNSTIRNIRIIDAPVYGIELARLGITSQGCERVLIDGCHVLNSYHDGIILDYAGQIIITNNIVEYFAFRSDLGDGIAIYNGSSSVTVGHNWVRLGNGSAIAAVSTQKGFNAFISITGNIAYGNLGAGVLVSPETGAEDNRTIDVAISGNTLFYNEWGVMLQFVTGVTVSGNSITGSTNSGIWANTSDALVISGNVIHSANDGGLSYDGITILDADSVRVVLIGNMLIDDGGGDAMTYGIKIAASVANATIIGCSCRGAAVCGIKVDGAAVGTKIAASYNGTSYIEDWQQ